jgi:hypothetical protein
VFVVRAVRSFQLLGICSVSVTGDLLHWPYAFMRSLILALKTVEGAATTPYRNVRHQSLSDDVLVAEERRWLG